MSRELFAGSARVSLEPPLDLPTVGFVRQSHDATGYDMDVYSADFPGPLRDFVRRTTGGEVVYLQGAGGNVVPKVAFTDSEDEAEAMGDRLAIEALHSLAGRYAYPRRMTHRPERSIVQISSYRRVPAEALPVALSATMRRVRFPLLPHPSLDAVRAVREEWEAKLAQAQAKGAGTGGPARIAWWHLAWARKNRAGAPRRHGTDVTRGPRPRDPDRRRRDRLRPGRGLQRDRDGGQGAQPRPADPVRRLQERPDRLLRDGGIASGALPEPLQPDSLVHPARV